MCPGIEPPPPLRVGLPLLTFIPKLFEILILTSCTILTLSIADTELIYLTKFKLN